MIRTIQKKYTLLITSAILLFFIGCGTEADPGIGYLEVRLHDAPGDYSEVNVFVESVQINRKESNEGWITISEPNQAYDLLKLTNGAYEVLGEAELETGTYSQIRLILSRENNNVVIDGVQHDLFIPSGAQTGIKLQVNAEIENDITYVLLLDFDADRSVVRTGNGNYQLKPVIRASNLAQTGNIDGIIQPAYTRPVVYAISGSDTLSTTFADTTSGEFRLVGLGAGDYTVSVNPRAEEYESIQIEDVTVTIGETHDLGEIVVPAVQ